MQDSDVNDKTPVGTLIPYYMKNLDPHNPTGREFFHFNDTTKWGDIATINSQAPSYDPFFMNYKEEIPSGYVQMLNEVKNPRKSANRMIEC